jgi:N-acetylmuramoyl-L-alanine amidase
MVRRIQIGSPVAALLALLLLALPSDAFARATASSVRLGIHEEGVTRFVMDLTDSMDFKVSTQSAPYRVVIETSGIDWASAPSVRKPLGSVNAVHGDDTRIILDLRSPATVKGAFVIPPRDNMSWRFVLDLRDTTREAFLASVQSGAAPALVKPSLVKPTAKPAAKVSLAAASPPAPPMAPPPPAPVQAAPVADPTAPVRTAPNRIVIASPNAGPPDTAPSSAPPSAPVPTVVAAPLPEPVVQSSPEPAVVTPPLGRRSPVGSKVAILTAPMPPPPERPAQTIAPIATAPVVVPPVVVPPPVAMPIPSPEPPAAAVLTPASVVTAPVAAPPAEPMVKARDGMAVVVIDPGHGGVDPGATGVSGIYEKFITLAVARELKVALERSGRYRVHLTRDRDVFIRLRDRVAIARQYGADLFISLHADAVQNPQIRGLSVYTLSQNASDNEAQTLAEKENKADLIAGIDLSHESADVAGILIDLAQRETMNRSAGFAGELVDEVGHDLDLLDNTHRFAGFAVLKAPDVPAVLVEMGYLSNDEEERNLRQPQYRGRLAKSIAKAVDRFFVQPQKAKRP